MSKLSNILTMLEYLSNGKKYSIKELSERLEVSPRMIRVYKDELEKAGIYIDSVKGPCGGYELNQNINSLKKFTNLNNVKINNNEYLKIVDKAIKEKSKCIIEYASKDGKSISKRTIIPYDLILLKDEWGVAAYCDLKQEIRHFYINRIKSIKILN